MWILEASNQDDRLCKDIWKLGMILKEVNMKP